MGARSPGHGSSDQGIFARALASTLQASAAPYGFALTLWGSGEMLRHFEGEPIPGEVLLFIGGAIAAFVLLGAQRASRRAPSLSPGRARIVAGELNLLGVGAALGVAALAAILLPGVLAWGLVPLLSTTVYLLAATVQLALSSAEVGG